MHEHVSCATAWTPISNYLTMLPVIIYQVERLLGLKMAMRDLLTEICVGLTNLPAFIYQFKCLLKVSTVQADLTTEAGVRGW